MVAALGGPDHNWPMFCPSCGTEIDHMPCPICGATTPTTTPRAISYSGWWRRVGATLADSLILLIPTSVIIGLFGWKNSWYESLTNIAIQGAYMFFMLTRPSGQTIGNQVVGTRVRDASTMRRITPSQALQRWGLVAVYSLPSVFDSALVPITVAAALADAFYPLFNARKQTWHDRVAGTVVLRG